jgi:hypothetical protein
LISTVAVPFKVIVVVPKVWVWLKLHVIGAPKPRGWRLPLADELVNVWTVGGVVLVSVTVKANDMLVGMASPEPEAVMNPGPKVIGFPWPWFPA